MTKAFAMVLDEPSTWTRRSFFVICFVANAKANVATSGSHVVGDIIIGATNTVPVGTAMTTTVTEMRDMGHVMSALCESARQRVNASTRDRIRDKEIMAFMAFYSSR